MENGTCYEVEPPSRLSSPVTTIASTATTIVSTITEIPIETTTTTTITTSSTVSGGSGSTIGGSTVTTSATIGVTTSISGSDSPIIYDPCSIFKCGHGKRCYNIDDSPICIKTDCLSCEDLDCPSQGLKCISFKVNRHKNITCRDCCQYIPTCST